MRCLAGYVLPSSLAIAIQCLLTGCICQPVRTDALVPINTVLLTSPVVTLDVYSINGAFPPQEAWDETLRRFKGCLSGQLVVQGPKELTVPVDKDGRLTGSVMVDAGPRQLDHIAILVCPEAADLRRGEYRRYKDGFQLIRYDKEGVEEYAWLVSRETLWKIVLLHELGHAIGVPADVSHADETGHCTNHCVMYRRPDARFALMVLVHGWNLDFCPACKAEIERAKFSAIGDAILISPFRSWERRSSEDAGRIFPCALPPCRGLGRRG